MQPYIWILTPDMAGIDLEQMDEYECLISTYYICDFLDDNKIPYKYYQMNNKFEWKLELKINDKKIISKLIEFKTGRFETSALYPICKYKLYQCYVMPDCEPEYLQTFDSIEEVRAYVQSISECPNIDQAKFTGWVKEDTNVIYKFIEESDEDDGVFIPIASTYDGSIMINMYALPEIN